MQTGTSVNRRATADRTPATTEQPTPMSLRGPVVPNLVAPSGPAPAPKCDRMTSERRQRIAAYAVLGDTRDRVLLVRASPEHSGLWFLPGGGVEFGEDPEAGLRREVEEETGQLMADLHLDRVLSDVATVDGTELHSVRLIYRATLAGVRPLRTEAPGSSTVETRWVPRRALSALDTAPFVPRALALRSSPTT